MREQQGLDSVQLPLLREPEFLVKKRSRTLMQQHDLAQQYSSRCLRMRLCDGNRGLLDLLNGIIADTGSCKLRDQVVYVVWRNS